MKRTRQRLVVVGNGMAGIRTGEELLRLAPDRYQITILGEEPHGNYNRILLSSLLAGEKRVEEIITHPLAWYEQHRITFRPGVAATRIDRAAGVVEDSRGERHPYDRLLLATGSHPVRIPVPGHQLPGVVSFRDLKDVEVMLSIARDHQRAVVIGGGLLGLEAAMGLLKQGMMVTVVHLMEILMERQLDVTAATMLRDELESRGLRFRLGALTEAILGTEQVTGIRFQDGSELAADLVVMAVGVRPNIDLAKTAELVCGRGLCIDDQMTTSDPRIVAVGECVEHRGVVYGLVAPLFEQGRILARHLAGMEEAGRYTGSVISTRLKVTGIDLFSAGDFLGDEGCEEILFKDPHRRVYKKLVIKNEVIQGGVLLGDAMDGPWYLEMMRDGTNIHALREHLLFGRSHHVGDAGHGGMAVGDLPESREICGCNGVTKGRIQAAILEKDLTTLEEIRLHTKASASCGSCTGLVEQILAHTLGGDYAIPVSKPLCGCTTLTSDAVRDAVRDRCLTTVPDTMTTLEWKTPDGCPACRQAINYYIHAFWPRQYQERLGDRFINERIHANIQKDGSYSVIPRIFGGLTTPNELRVIADLVERFAIPEVKFTGGQRLTMLGVQKEDLPAIWAELGRNGMLSGHAYGKALRTVKTCVGSHWCRFGTQDSEAMGVQLEKLLWNCWTPHKFKLAVSGCPRNCAEATIKDFGVVAVDSGWELHVGGNGGIKVRVTDLLTKVATMDEVLEYAGSFMQFYRTTARYLERTAPWVERVGLEWIHERLVQDDNHRRRLYAAFTEAHAHLPDPWEQRAHHGVAATEFAPMAILHEATGV
ncbi:MAG: NAD(P)/FAD-dependent oxidoreductase [Magnetococcales bacterium]|nr:NAD(P)/FAD-dependent oxidoreductase [Magnetococcales bacterium]